MTALITRFRGAFIALVVLTLTAGAALAGGGPPPAADGGLATARDASGQLVPLGGGVAVDEDGDEDVDEDVDEAVPTDDEADDEVDENVDEADEDAANCTDVDPANHGALVCWAAQNAPDGWTGGNGEWVSCVARLSNNGHAVEGAEPIVWADLTPEACTDALTAAKEAKAAERAAAKAEREAAKAEREAARAARADARAGKLHGKNN